MLRSLALLVVLAFAPMTAAAQVTSEVPAVTASDRILGRASAPVTVIEYASLTCSHCGDWHRTVYPEFKRQFIDTGRVRMVFRDFPTPPAQVAARASGIARCAAPARFHDVVDAFFQGQPAYLAGGPVAAWYASGIAVSGRTQAQMDACLADPATLEALRTSVSGGVAAGVQGTPTFFVNGQIIQDRSMAGLTAAINPLLPRARRL